LGSCRRFCELRLMPEPLAPRSCGAGDCLARGWACRTSGSLSSTSPEADRRVSRPNRRLFGCLERLARRGALFGPVRCLGGADLRELMLDLLRIVVLRGPLAIERDLRRHLAVGARTAQPGAQRL